MNRGIVSGNGPFQNGFMEPEYETPMLGGRGKIWVKKEVERTVAPERKDAGVETRVTRARSKEA